MDKKTTIQPQETQLFQELMDLLNSYLKKDLSAVEKAYNLALQAHSSQKRNSGEPYIIHPLSVAIILAKLHMDIDIIIAGILHDVIEDTKYTAKDIEDIFGGAVADMVQGVTNLQDMEYIKSRKAIQAENHRKLFLSMASDIRTVVIKIADRLHNMRTLMHMPLEKQKKKSIETLDIYAPIAARIGMANIKNELEDLAFKYLEPEAYSDLVQRIDNRKQDIRALVDQMILTIKQKMYEEKINCVVDGRLKHYFSIYKKKMKSNVELEQIYDVFAIRIIVNSNDKNECYKVFGIIQNMYKDLPGRIKDYINRPKSNGYQSIHTTVIGIDDEPFEIQIRTRQMHDIAENGLAAHWKYKEGGQKAKESEVVAFKTYTSLFKQLTELAQISDDAEFMQGVKTQLDIYDKHIYCLTPDGDLIELLLDSTPVDFAYAIHAAIGNTMVGAKVNSNMVAFDHKLKTHDRVEILTSKNSPGPKVQWLDFVKTSAAKNRINNWLKQETKIDNNLKGKNFLEKELLLKNLVPNEILTENYQNFLLHTYNYISWGDFLAAIGRGLIPKEQVVKRLLNHKKTEEIKAAKVLLNNKSIVDVDISSIVSIQQNKSKTKTDSGVIIQGVGEIAANFPKCCTPLPGDIIKGYVSQVRGITVHRADCINLLHLAKTEHGRVIDVVWNIKTKEKTAKYLANIVIYSEDRARLLLDITTVLADMRANVHNLNALPSKDNLNVIAYLTVEINSSDHLDRVINKLQNIKNVYSVQREIT